MGRSLQKIAELEFNEDAALMVIASIGDVKDIFSEEVNMSLEMVMELKKGRRTPPKITETIKTIFDKIILTKSDCVALYRQMLEELPKPKGRKKAIKQKEPKLPRRYGAEQINRDIERAGGKATNAQLTALAINELKNLYVKLNTRMVKELLSENGSLSDEDYREIRSTITMVKNKMRPILKKS